MRPPKALLIDLDDTLINYDGVATAAWFDACNAAANNHPLTVEALVEAIEHYAHWYWSDSERHRVGRNNLEETRRLTAREALKRLGHPDDELGNLIGDAYCRIRDEKLHLFPGTREALESLKQNGVPMCLVTNGEKHLQRRKIERFLLEPYFKGILIEGELGYGKPDERVFKQALEILGVPARDSWIIGDNYEWEVVAPRKLGFTCVWVDNRQSGPPAGAVVRPHAIISIFSEVPDLIQAARNGD